MNYVWARIGRFKWISIVDIFNRQFLPNNCTIRIRTRTPKKVDTYHKCFLLPGNRYSIRPVEPCFAQMGRGRVLQSEHRLEQDVPFPLPGPLIRQCMLKCIRGLRDTKNRAYTPGARITYILANTPCLVPRPKRTLHNVMQGKPNRNQHQVSNTINGWIMGEGD